MKVVNVIEINGERMHYMGSHPALPEDICDYCNKTPNIQTPFHMYMTPAKFAAFVCDDCAETGKVTF